MAPKLVEYKRRTPTPNHHKDQLELIPNIRHQQLIPVEQTKEIMAPK